MRKGTRLSRRQVPLPILCLSSVVSLAVFGLPGNGIQLAPGLSPGLIDLALFLLGKLLVGDKFLHTDFLLVWFLKSVYHNRARMHKRFVNPDYKEAITHIQMARYISL